MGSSNEPKTGKAILERLVKNKDKGAGRKRIISNAKTFLEFIVFKKGLDERLVAGWYFCSGQRKRYLKSIMKDKKG